MNIKMNGIVLTHQELNLKEYYFQGKKYIDVTPFWIDSKETYRIKQLFEERKEMDE